MEASAGLDPDGKEDRLDEAAGIIRGFSVMEPGEFRGQGMPEPAEADTTTLAETVRLANAAVDSATDVDRRLRGLKMRKHHPGMSEDAFGSTMAAARNFRLGEDGRIRADLQFLEAANAEDRRHVFALARERPDFFATSLVVSGKLEPRFGQDGKRLKTEDGKPVLPLFRPSAVHALDFVDKGAATPSGFFADSSALLSAEATEQLATVAQLDDFPTRVRAFLSRIDSYVPGVARRLRDALTNPGDPMPKETDAEPGKAELSNDEMVAKLKAAGFQVGKPAPAPEASPGPGADPVLAELKTLREGLEAERKARLESEARAAAATLKLEAAAFKGRLAKLAHVDAALRDQAAGHVETLLGAGQSEAAERLVAGYEAIPDLASLAMLNTEISVPLDGGKSRTVDLSRYQRLRDGEDGPEAVLDGDRDEMAAAALASELPTPEERRDARLKIFTDRAKRGGVA